MSAISGTRRAFKELVDGTIRVQIDVDPRFKKEFFEMFPNVDTPCAIAPLVLDFERREPEEEPKGGALCKLAAMWCKDREFKAWLAMRLNYSVPIETDEHAANALRAMLNITSRKKLDNDDDAAGRFQSQIRVPFMEWRRAAHTE